MSAPASWPVAIQPREKPSCSSGTLVATIAVAAAENPLKTPIAARAPINCQTFCTSPISAVKMQMAMHDRTTIALRPTRSAREPQIGEKIAAKKKFDEAITPAQRSTFSIGCTPS